MHQHPSLSPSHITMGAIGFVVGCHANFSSRTEPGPHLHLPCLPEARAPICAANVRSGEVPIIECFPDGCASSSERLKSTGQMPFVTCSANQAWHALVKQQTQIAHSGRARTLQAMLPPKRGAHACSRRPHASSGRALNRSTAALMELAWAPLQLCRAELRLTHEVPPCASAVRVLGMRGLCMHRPQLSLRCPVACMH